MRLTESNTVNINMEYVQKCLKNTHVTQKELADYLGISLRTYAYWKKQDRMPMDAFIAVCALFGWLDVPQELLVSMPSLSELKL